MLTFRYEIVPRAEDLGGGWELKMYESDEEVGGIAYPSGAGNRPSVGLAWFNGLNKEDRERWLNTKSDERPVDAWRVRLCAEAHRKAKAEGDAWLASYQESRTNDS